MAIHRQVGLPWDEDPLGKAAYNTSTSVALTDCPSLQFPSACSRDVIATPVTEPGGRNDSHLLLNHQSPMSERNFTQSLSPTSRPSLQSPFLPTDPSTCSRDVQVMEPSGRNDSQLMPLSHWFPIPSDIYLSSPNTTFAQSPDRSIDDHWGGHNSPLVHNEIRDTDMIPEQHMVYTCPYQHNADMSSQTHPTFSKLEMLKNGREFLGS